MKLYYEYHYTENENNNNATNALDDSTNLLISKKITHFQMKYFLQENGVTDLNCY